MASLNNQQINLIREALKKCSEKVKLNNNWRNIFRELEVGELDGSETYLCFSPSDLVLLRNMAKLHTGFDPLHFSLDRERRDIAREAKNDKLARIKPSDGFLLIKHAGFKVDCFENTSLRVGIEELFSFIKIENISELVIVENLDAFDYWFEFYTPEHLSHALVIYRGHDTGTAKGLKTLLKGDLLGSNVTVFPDFDPDGIKIAHTIRKVTHILVPELESLETILKLSSEDDYNKQYKAEKYLDENLDCWLDVWRYMKSNRASIKQQHLLAHKSKLTCVPI